MLAAQGAVAQRGLDRIQAPQMLEERFPDVPGQTLRDFLARYGPDATALLDR